MRIKQCISLISDVSLQKLSLLNLQEQTHVLYDANARVIQLDKGLVNVAVSVKPTFLLEKR